MLKMSFGSISCPNAFSAPLARVHHRFRSEAPCVAARRSKISSSKIGLECCPGVLRPLRDLSDLYPNGVITWRGTQWYLSGCLKNELVGLEDVDNDRWRVFFGTSSSASLT